ncbi:alanine dehydrogenase [Rhodospira trueperi]|uniref:Alanine dehydrogenase n=1 Tax=Rhodospira trueperi TaxID=69960 RepID=A0A1G6W6T9_9PROT|nr:alanine dehydrogenase [Rhodospira trueperi]SDD60755.1 alanine dehydrogenase [Rhodospira trueperi]
MRIGVPREIKPQEFRVGLMPDGVRDLVAHGHHVVVEAGAGIGIDATDEDYRGAGAVVLGDADAVFDQADMIVKVKEPQAVERARLRPDQILFTYLHLAPDEPQTSELIASGTTCIAYETITDAHGGLPLLKPMSQVAGRLSVQAGARALERAQGGRGLLLGGVPGVGPARVAVIGGGVVGENAVEMALGLGADVTVLDRNPAALERLAHRFGAALTTLYASRATLERTVIDADMVIGAVLVAGAGAPKLVSRDMVARMRKGTVLVDVAIDQGGCFDTSRATTHDEPTFIVEDVVHYCVANMPGAVPLTSTQALTNATLPFVLRLADQGWRAALKADPHLRRGLNVAGGQVTCQPVAEAQGLPFTAPETLLDG